MEYEGLNELKKSLDELMGNLRKAQEMSSKQQESIDTLQDVLGKLSLNRTLNTGDRAKLEEIFGGKEPQSKEEIEAKIKSIEEQKADFDQRNEMAAIEAKAKIEEIRAISEKKFADDLVFSEQKRTNSMEKAKEAIRSGDEAFKAEMEEKANKMKERADAKAEQDAREAVIKEIVAAGIKAEKPDIKPEELEASVQAAIRNGATKTSEFIAEFNKSEYKIMQLTKYEEFRKAAFDKIDAIAAKAFENVKNGSVITRNDEAHAKLIEDQKAFRADLDAQMQFLSEEFPDAMSKTVKKEEETAMTKYEKQVAQYQQLEKLEASKQAELDKINAELAKNPDDKDLQAKKAAVENELKSLKDIKPKLASEIAESKKILGIEDKEEKGEGEGKGEGGTGKGEGEGKGEDGTGKGEEGEGKGDDVITIDPDVYYKSLNLLEKHATRAEAYAVEHGRKDADGNYKAGLITRALLWVPGVASLLMSKNTCIEYLRKGYIPPRYLGEGQKLLTEAESTRTTIEQPKKEDPKKEDIFRTADEETKKKIAQIEQDAKIKAEIAEGMKNLSPEAKAKLQAAMEMMTKTDGKKENKPTKEAER